MKSNVRVLFKDNSHSSYSKHVFVELVVKEKTWKTTISTETPPLATVNDTNYDADDLPGEGPHRLVRLV